MTYGLIALKLILGLAALVIVTRVLGKKEMSQITPFDFVYALILGGLVEENLFKKKPASIWEMLFGIAVWAVLIYIVEKVTQKFDKMRPILKGREQSLIEDGEIQLDNLDKAELEMDQLRALLRQKGVFSLNQVKHAILETSGTISVMLKPEEQPVTYSGMDIKAPNSDISVIVVDEGKPRHENLKKIGKDEKWLVRSLKEHGINDLPNVFFAEWSETDGFFIQLNKKGNHGRLER
ncbi:DUF421 domain-containing protein [Bacillus sp. REN3]|uniref:DUF421 domain-containing protein n=1 Tax=Bacillus sp. REN3 TaxID=2802440 RepID=UPI001AEE8268|nr:DUF421 domain-containing protein [Bacillus sp. REN3]